MNLLSLKAIFWDEPRKGFFSPSRNAFQWFPGIVQRECNRGCEIDIINPDCTCGIYSSPNTKTLVEYAKRPNAVFALLNNYGWVDIWTGPHEFPGTYVLRSWGVKVVGIVGTMTDGSALQLEPRRYQSALIGLDYFQVKIYPWEVAKEMMKFVWMRDVHINPFEYSERPIKVGFGNPENVSPIDLGGWQEYQKDRDKYGYS